MATPDKLTPNFEHQFLEADMKRLANEISDHRERVESKNLSDQDLIKRSIQGMVADKNDSTPSEASSQGPLPDYASGASDETKLEVEHLLDMAFHEGIEKANAEAKKSSPFVLDAFHDALVGKLYDEFKKRGFIK